MRLRAAFTLFLVTSMSRLRLQRRHLPKDLRHPSLGSEQPLRRADDRLSVSPSVQFGSAARIRFTQHLDANGALSVYEAGTEVPFVIRRVFVVTTAHTHERGHHAHRRGAQLLVSLAGCVAVRCDNGVSRVEHILDRPNEGLLIGPGVWAEQSYLLDHSVLMVLCDLPYEEADYVRSYEEFRKLALQPARL